ncbi:MAG TPA: M28 family peptidase [Allosphingosinicella sp.]|nr:M28 family peptidase [Allosphingosinicella sp.]
MTAPQTWPAGALRSAFALIIALLLLVAAMAAKGILITLPAPPDVAAAGAFDSRRAVARLARVLGDERAHPVDSDASDLVRARLLAEMRAVGLNPRVTDDFVCNSFVRSRTIACARVRNLVATTGPAEGRHLLLSAHYDSTFAGPGAGDAGIGVATLLETAALLRGRRLIRPVTFLFNEGEEMGLLGARAFLGRDPIAARVDSLINLEARGVEGPAVMFETSRPNAPAVAAFASAVSRPVANSLTTDLYGLIPNSTDVAVFAGRGWTILNFGIIGNETRYHSAGDNLAALDQRSLQHMGDQTLALAQTLAGAPAPTASGQRLYADLLGRRLVTLPMLPGLALLGALLFGFLLLAWRRRALGQPLLAMIAATIGATGLAWLGQFLLGLFRVGDYWRGHPLVTVTAVHASALAACLIVLLLIARHADRSRLRAAYWLYFLLTGAALAAIAPGAAIFFLFPPAIMALGMMARRWHDSAERVTAIVAALSVFLTFGPALALFEELMSNGPHWMFAPLGSLILLPFMIELVPLARRVVPILAYAAAGDLFLLGWLAVLLTPAYSEDRRQQYAIEYVRGLPPGQARWAVNNDGAPVPFAADWRREEVPWSSRRRWLAPAPALAIPAPRVELLSQQRRGEGRSLTLRLRSGGAQSVTLIAPPDSGLREAGSGAFSGHFAAETGPEARYFLRCIGRACDGAIFNLVADKDDPIDFTIVGSRPGLPPQAAPLAQARPALSRPQYAPDSTLTIARIRL